ncbi:MAG: hypothetical protein ACKO4T_01325 [Planctomycetaceae bacterium]
MTASSWRLGYAGVILALACIPAAAEVAVTRHDDRIDVAVDGAAFTSYIAAGHRKPILFPVLGPGGTPAAHGWPRPERGKERR